jgi:hypothetical protein
VFHAKAVPPRISSIHDVIGHVERHRVAGSGFRCGAAFGQTCYEINIFMVAVANVPEMQLATAKRARQISLPREAVHKE